MTNTTDSEAIVSYLIAGGVVGYQRALARAVGSHSAGLLLSQLWFWSERIPAEREGWFWKTQAEIEEETVMTRREQETARRILREFGILHEQRRGVPAKLWFRINRQAVMRLLKEKAALLNGGKRHPSMAENGKQAWTEPTGKRAQTRQANTKNTAEITPTTTAALHRRPAGLLNNNVDAVRAAADPGLVEELLGHDLNRTDAYRLARERPEECRRQLEYLRYLPARTNPGGWLRDAIENGHGAPRGYREAKQREARTARAGDLHRIQKARQEHQEHSMPAYLDYLRARAAEMQRAYSDAFSAFTQSEAEKRRKLEGSPLTLRTRTRLLRQFDTDAQHLDRFCEFFSQQPNRAIFRFWEWDAKLNPSPFERRAA